MGQSPPLSLLGTAKQPSPVLRAWLQALVIFIGVVIVSVLYDVDYLMYPKSITAQGAGLRVQQPVLVSYSYFEKDSVQLANMEFFIAVGMGVASTFKPPANTDFVIVLNGDACAPCKKLLPLVVEDKLSLASNPELSAAYTSKSLTMLQRKENEGMDFAAHNVTVEWLRRHGQYKKYSYFLILNSSTRGPFFPSYMPANWQWTEAYTERLKGNVKVISSSLVCLPPEDAGGFGPKVESWAFGVDREGLDLLTAEGVFNLRTCKLCNDGVVVMGEYGVTRVLFSKGYNIATLMSRYGKDVDWRNERHWHCNDNVHPSRHGTYDGISMHPFETVFIKASWHVGEPHLSHYTRWLQQQAAGQDSTTGVFDPAMYRYAITEKAQEPNNAEECFKVLK